MNEMGPIPASPDMVGKTCSLCKMPIQAGSAVTVCPACKNPHHAACWQKSGGCGVYGCAQSRIVVGQPAPQAAGQGSCPTCGYVYGPMETTCRKCSGGAMRTEGPREAYRSGGGFPWTMVVIVLVALGLIGGVVYLATGGGVKDGGIRLEYKFKPGQTDTYDVTANANVSAPLAVDVQVTGNVVQKVLSVLPDGGAKVEVSIRNMNMTSSMAPSGAMPPTPDETHTVTISKTGTTDGSWQKSAFSSMPGGNLGGMNALGAGAILPDHGVDVGQTWTGSLPLVKDISMNVTSTLVTDSEMVDGHKCCKIDQKYEMDEDIVKIVEATGEKVPGNVSGRMKLTGTGTVYFAKDEGRLIKQDMKINMNMNIKGAGGMGGGPEEMNMQMDMSVLTVLAK